MIKRLSGLFRLTDILNRKYWIEAPLHRSRTTPPLAAASRQTLVTLVHLPDDQAITTGELAIPGHEDLRSWRSWRMKLKELEELELAPETRPKEQLQRPFFAS